MVREAQVAWYRGLGGAGGKEDLKAKKAYSPILSYSPPLSSKPSTPPPLSAQASLASRDSLEIHFDSP